jgi:hypothetical protein
MSRPGCRPNREVIKRQGKKKKKAEKALRKRQRAEGLQAPVKASIPNHKGRFNEMKKLMVVALTLMVMPCFGAISFAGNLDDTGSPTAAGGGAMNTLEDIYNILDDGTTNVPRTGTFTEPSAGPTAGTGHTLTEVYDRAKTSSRPAKTGQTTSYGTGSDGDLEKGVVWPNPRFTDNSNGTVTDNLTGLIWLKNANCDRTKTWADALTYCNNLAHGACGLTDGSSAGDWRLPNVKELQSLIDFDNSDPALPTGNPFTDVQSFVYWSSTTYADDTPYAWEVDLYDGYVSDWNKDDGEYDSVWPVRGGQ